MRISVVGGGIAGLALAARLDPERFDVTVHERNSELPTAGTVLGMWPAAQRALDRLGVLEAAHQVSTPLETLAVRDGHGRVLAKPTVRGTVGIARAELLRLLAEAVPASVSRQTTKVADPEALPGDLVVGADGAHSVVRADVWGARSAARPARAIAVRGVVADELWREDAGEYWLGGALFGVTRHRDGTNWFAAFASGLGSRDIDVEAAVAEVRDRCGGRADGVDRVLRAVVPEGTIAQRIWVVPPLRSYVRRPPVARRPVVLVGDAAHAMTPNLGRGACEALIDAVTLADKLNTLPTADALAAYDRARVGRTQALRAASAGVLRVALADRAAPVRDRLIRVAGRLAPA
ncbi:FAD-dependent monooxygenase [Georgenia deserti]|uniref:FAD-dependent monooxygenase n=1 Tax=Georgenia deserti TaxID=2093781 RepID=A0ABW4L3V2_9MICO